MRTFIAISVGLNLLLAAAAARVVAIDGSAGGIIDAHWLLGILPWILLALAFVLLANMARFVQRRAGQAQFVVLRGRVSCPECSYLLDLDDRHCARCGYAVAQVKQRVSCTQCRARNWEDDTFCRQCGERMAAPEPEKPAES